MKTLDCSLTLHQYVFALTILLFTAISHAQDNQDITVVTELFDRYQLIDKENELSGYSVDVVKSLFALLGESHEIEIYPWSVAYQKAQQSPNVMIFSIDRNREREKKFHWVARLHQEPIYFWSLKSLNIPTVTGLNSLQHFTIAVVKDANSHRYLVNRNFNNIYLMTSTFSNIDASKRLKMMNGARAKIVIASEHDVINTLESVGLQRSDIAKVFHDPELDNNLYIAFSLQTKSALVKKYQTAFEQLVASGRFAEIQQKWHLKK